MSPGAESKKWMTFTGADRLITLIGALLQRPKRGDRPRALDVDGTWSDYTDLEKRGLPMLYLQRPAEGAASVLPGVAAWIQSTQPQGRVLYAEVDSAAAADEDDADAADLPGDELVKQVREILHAARDGFMHHTGRELTVSFPLFTMLYNLTKKPLARTDADPDHAMFERLRKQATSTETWTLLDRETGEIIKDAPRQVKVALWVARWIDYLIFWARVTGRVPVLSGRFRWFLKQPHLAPQTSGTFVRFARRLTAEAWPNEDPEFVSRLLVNAFVEDLRRAYRLRPWHTRRRRMTYAVLLLRRATGANGGLRLLELINRVRNQTGEFDPLLVVVETTAPPPKARPDRPVEPAEEAIGQFRIWQHELRKRRLARTRDTWYLPLAVGANRDEAAVRKLKELDHYHLRRKWLRPRFRTTRFVRFVAPLLVLALASWLLIDAEISDSALHCDSDVDTVVWTGTECVGVSDGSVNLFWPADDTIEQVVSLIGDQNRQVAALHEANPDRPYITVVDFEAFTSSTGTADGLVAERESLEGFAVAQFHQLNVPNTAEPLVRVLIANGGRGMREGVRVAGIVRDLAARDSSIVAVVGLDISSTPTQNAISALATAGIPIVASTLSADSLADDNPMYFAVAPQNRREAQVAAAFVDHLHTPEVPRSVRVYYSDDSADIYSSNLRDDAIRAFRDRGFAVAARAFVPDDTSDHVGVHNRKGDPRVGNADAAGRDTCRYDGYVFFAGRGVPDFGAFMDGAAQCGSTAVILADDDVTRHVADANARHLRPALPYYYLSFATAPIREPDDGKRFFYDTQARLFAFEQDPAEGRSLDGHAALSYDAAGVVITAARYLRETASIPVSPGAIWREITAIHTSRPGDPQEKNHLEGVTGTIDYGGDLGRNVPEDKPVAVLRVVGGDVTPGLQGFCGRSAGHLSQPWCPPDPGPAH